MTRDVFEFEQEHWFGRTWVSVGREADLSDPGTYALVDVAGESVIVVRGRDALCAPSTTCAGIAARRSSTRRRRRNRRIVRFQCPYHAWIYDLDGALRRAPHTDALVDFEAAENELVPVDIETWAGFVFVNLDSAAAALSEYLADLPAAVAAYPMAGLRRARRIEYEVAANWKVIGENYTECYHCPGVHPQLNRLSPYDRGRNLESRRAVGGRLDGARRRCGHDVRGWARPRPPAARRASRRQPAAHLLLRGLAQPAAQPASRLRDDPPGLAARRRPVARRLRVALRAATWRDRTSTLPMRSTSGT